jgi:hypothetical protein
MNIFALNATLQTTDIETRGDSEFRVIGTNAWITLDGLTDAQRSTYDTELAALTARRTSDTRIAELKKMLIETDYVALPDYDKDKAAVLADRQTWREEIRTLEADT